MIIEKIKRHTGINCRCKCDYCGKEFDRRMAKIKGRIYQYCCKICKHLGHKKEIAGNKNGMFGKHHSEETRIKISLNREPTNGDKCPRWKYGRRQSGGHIMIYKPNHPNCRKDGYVYEHRLAMEQYLGRLLNPEEVVHHINKNTSDNRIENLLLFASQKDHSIYHRDLKIKQNQTILFGGLND